MLKMKRQKSKVMKYFRAQARILIKICKVKEIMSQVIKVAQGNLRNNKIIKSLVIIRRMNLKILQKMK